MQSMLVAVIWNSKITQRRLHRRGYETSLESSLEELCDLISQGRHLIGNQVDQFCLLHHYQLHDLIPFETIRHSTRRLALLTASSIQLKLETASYLYAWSVGCYCTNWSECEIISCINVNFIDWINQKRHFKRFVFAPWLYHPYSPSSTWTQLSRMNRRKSCFIHSWSQ